MCTTFTEICIFRRKRRTSNKPSVMLNKKILIKSRFALKKRLNFLFIRFIARVLIMLIKHNKKPREHLPAILKTKNHFRRPSDDLQDLYSPYVRVMMCTETTAAIIIPCRNRTFFRKLLTSSVSGSKHSERLQISVHQ